MRRVALVVLAIAVMMIVAWLANDTSVGALLSTHRHELLTYGIKVTTHI
jgi:hypothetical protein